MTRSQVKVKEGSRSLGKVMSYYFAGSDIPSSMALFSSKISNAYEMTSLFTSSATHAELES